MGIKNLWRILSPYCEKKPLYELEGKVIAIDLAGWICESLNVVDYFVHPKQYLKNLFFRTCYLLLEGIIPLFVLEGKAPKLKYQVIAARNELQFRGVKPKNINVSEENKENKCSKQNKGRTRFNYVLKQCENLVKCMGLPCVQGPGEAEAYCAFLNKRGLVEGIVSQDSDCFAYGAIKVYRNFSVTSGVNSAGQNGSVDVYDMTKITEALDIGQNKIIVMALLCGCDYCPEGISGVGSDSVVKFLKKYKDSEIVSKIKSWRENSNKYTSLEMRVDNKNICTNCGHLGKLQSHSRNGCSSCNYSQGCDSNLWKEQRLSIKAELTLREKALSDPNFPSQEIIDEFLSEPDEQPKLNLKWDQPNLCKFIKTVAHLLQWTEIYCFQKFFPLLTRWQIHNYESKSDWNYFVIPDFIKKKRVLRGIACYEIIWKDEKEFFKNLIPDDQIDLFVEENPKGIEVLWSTLEPREKVEKAYPLLVEKFEASTKKPKKSTQTKRGRKKKVANNSGLQDMSGILQEANEIEKKLKRKERKRNKPPPKGVQMITNFLIRNNKGDKFNTPSKFNDEIKNNCSTPKEIVEHLPINLTDDDENNFDFSDIINAIVDKPNPLSKLDGKILKYDEVRYKKNRSLINQSQDDLVLITASKRNSSIRILNKTAKKLHLCYDSTEDIYCEKEYKSDDEIVSISLNELKASTNGTTLKTHIDRFKSKNTTNNSKSNVSYFFGRNNHNDDVDEFEKSIDFSFLKDSDSE